MNTHTDTTVVIFYFQLLSHKTYMRIAMGAADAMDVEDGVVQGLLIFQREADSVQTTAPILASGLLQNPRERL